MTRLAARLGIELPDQPVLIAAGVALGIVFLAWLIAVIAGRTGGPRLARLWEKHAGTRSEGISQRMCDLVRYLIAALLLAVALKAHAWEVLPAAVLGFPLAAAAALMIRSVVRGLHMPRWVALLLGGAAFVALLADALGGLAPITDVLAASRSMPAGPTYRCSA